MRKFFGFWIFLAIHMAGYSQTITVKDKITHQPLELVTIYAKKTEESAITGLKGTADLSPFKDLDSISFRLIGYETAFYSYQQLKDMDFMLFLSESNISLNEHVVSATRWEQDKREIPNKITTIKPIAITEQNPQTSADLLEVSGDVFVQKSQLGGGSPIIRGFSTNRVLLVVDGVRMNNAIFRSGNLQNVISLDPFATKNIEIIFGPGSVMYGSDAIGGVMNFYTLTPHLSVDGRPLVKLNALVRSSSANFEKTGHMDLSIGSEKWGFTTSASYSDYDDLVMGSRGPKEYLRPQYVEIINGRDSVISNKNPEKQVPTGYQQMNLMQKIRYKPDDYLDFVYGFHYSATSEYSRYDRLIRYRNGKPRSAEWYYGPQIWSMNSLNMTYTKKNAFFNKLGATLAYQYFKESRHNRDLYSTEKFNRTELVHAISLNVDLEKDLTTNQKLFYGIDGIFNYVGSTGTDENIETKVKVPGSSRYPDGSLWGSLAAYVNYRFKINDKVTWQTGLRYNQVMLKAEFDTTFFKFPFQTTNMNTGAVSGSTGLAINPMDNLQVNFNFSTGFRAPNVDDIGKIFDSEPGSVVVPNPNLKSEYAYNAELGVAKIIKDVVKLDITGYYTILDNALVRRDYSFNGQDSIVYNGEMSKVQAIQNAAKANVYGIQAGIEIKLPCGFGAMSKFNYQKGEEELDDGTTAPLRHAAPWFGSSHLTYKRNRFKADLYMLYNGEVSYKDLAPSEISKDYMYAKDKDGNPYSPLWHTFNIKGMYQATDFLLFSFGVENIANLRYKTYSSGIVAPGRNFILSVKTSL